jgi:hypothetical protein
MSCLIFDARIIPDVISCHTSFSDLFQCVGLFPLVVLPLLTVCFSRFLSFAWQIVTPLCSSLWFLFLFIQV